MRSNLRNVGLEWQASPGLGNRDSRSLLQQDHTSHQDMCIWDIENRQNES